MSIPPTVDRLGESKSATDDLKRLVTEVREAMNALSDYLNGIAASAHPDMVLMLIEEGVDERGRFGSSSAQKTADEFHKLLRKAASHAITTGKAMDASYIFWLKQVKQPIEAARARRDRQSRMVI